MAEHSTIEWTDATVNFWWGCTKVGPGCDHCYAEAFDKRVGGAHWGSGVPRRKIKGAVALIHKLDNAYADWAADVTCADGNAKVFGLPYRRHGGLRRRVFIQSMSDLFDLEVPLEWFAEAWDRITVCSRIDIQIVTKRISAVEKRLDAIGCSSWPRHVGLLVTVCNQQEADRDVPRLLALKAKLGIPWVGLSIEPMLGAIDLRAWLEDIDWVIVGGESGHGARPMHPDWARSMRDQCAAAGVPFFFKQWGDWRPATDDGAGDPPYSTGKGRAQRTPAFFVAQDGNVHCFTTTEEKREQRLTVMLRVGKKAAGRLLDGVEHNGMPDTQRAAAGAPEACRRAPETAQA